MGNVSKNCDLNSNFHEGILDCLSFEAIRALYNESNGHYGKLLARVTVSLRNLQRPHVKRVLDILIYRANYFNLDLIVY